MLWLYLIIDYGAGEQSFFNTIKINWKVITGVVAACFLLSTTHLKLRFSHMFKRKEKYSTEIFEASSHNASSEPLNQEPVYIGDDVEITVKPSATFIREEHPVAVIPETCIIKGELNCTSDIHINGRVDGVIRSEKSVHILTNGHVEGDIIAGSIAIDGVLQGNCIGREVSINANGTVNGQVKSDSLSIDKQGRFYGHSMPREEDTHEPNLIK